MRQAALARKPGSEMVRAKISTNSTIAQNFKISKINGEPIYSKEGKLFIEIRTIKAVYLLILTNFF